MSTMEKVQTAVRRLSEKQLSEVLIFIENMDAIQQSNDINESDDVDEVFGIMHDAADPELIPLEEKAWEMAVRAKYGEAVE